MLQRLEQGRGGSTGHETDRDIHCLARAQRMVVDGRQRVAALGFGAVGVAEMDLDELARLAFTAGAKYGDSWEVLFGYNVAIGNAEQDPQGKFMWDRDNFVFNKHNRVNNQLLLGFWILSQAILHLV